MTPALYGLRSILADAPLLLTPPALAPRETHRKLICQALRDLVCYRWQRARASAELLQKLFEEANHTQPPLTPETPLCVYAVSTKGRDNGAVWSGIVREWHLRKLKRLKAQGLFVVAGCFQGDEELERLMRAGQEAAGRAVALLDLVGHGDEGYIPITPRHLPALAPGASVLLECCEAAKGPYNSAGLLAEANPSVTVWASAEMIGNARPALRVAGGRVEISGALCITSFKSLFWGASMTPHRAGESG